VYNTTDGTNLERGYMRWSSNILQIGTEKAGTGSVRGIDFQTDGATNMRLGSDGSVSILDGSGGAQINFNVQASNGVRIASDRPLGFTSGFAANSSPDTTLRRVDAGIIGVRAGAITNGGALSFIEQTAPAAPAANGVYVYAEDDGAGKTRLMARFATGAAVQIAIEP
jgi:hypothetical protein